MGTREFFMSTSHASIHRTSSSVTAMIVPIFRFPVTERCRNEKGCVRLRATIYWRQKKTERLVDHEEGPKTATSHTQKHHKHNLIQRTFEMLTHYHNKADRGNTSVYDGHSYKDELEMYIAESSANLRYDNDGLHDSSDDDTSEEDVDPVPTFPRNTVALDFSGLITSIPLSKTIQEFVVPPVEVPCKYRRQDRKGGVLVAGRHVLFTNWAFKRQLRHMGRLGSLPECADARPHSLEKVSVRLYAGKLVQL